MWSAAGARWPRTIAGLGLVASLLLSGCLRGERDTLATEPPTPSASLTATVPASTGSSAPVPTMPPATTPTPTPAPQTAAEQTQPIPEMTAPDVTEVAPIIDQMVADVPAHVGIVIEQMDGAVIYAHAQDDLFEAASLYKLAIMAEVYRAREAGTLSFEDEIFLEPAYFVEGDDVYVYDADVGSTILVGDALYYMITASSNVAAAALLHTVGTAEVNSLMTDLGLYSTEIRWEPFNFYESPEEFEETPEDSEDEEDAEPEIESDGESEEQSRINHSPPYAAAEPVLAPIPSARTARTETRMLPNPQRQLNFIAQEPVTTGKPFSAAVDDAYNLTTPNDMARFFQLLLDGAIVSTEASDAMLELLAQQMINDRLPASLPSDTRVAHKTGNLPGTVHDAGVIYTPRGPVIVVVMSDQADDEDEVVTLMQHLSALVYDVMSQ